MPPLTEDQVKEIVKETVKETLREFLSGMGIDVSNPLQMQRDFHRLKEWGETMELIKSKTIGTLILVLITGFIGFLWVALKDHFPTVPHINGG
jgi:hypothetical protein